jgi:long-chain acyl-CoA synthetase
MKAEGLQAGDRVSVCMRNRIEWVFFDQAASGLGLITVPLYFGDRADNMAWCMNDAGVRLLVLESDELWPELKGDVKTLERIITLAEPQHPHKNIVGLSDWLPAAAGEPMQSDVDGGELATIVYTSGTTGRPKGVMLSHYNILSNADAGLSVVTITDTDRFVSFLPLSHMFERTVGYYVAVITGAHTVYARGITELGDDIAMHQPTILVCVPRIFERIYARMQENLPPGSLKTRLFNAAVNVGWRRFRHEATLLDHLLWPILKLLVAKKLYRRLGGRIRIILVGAAALTNDLARVFVGLGLPILQGYGLTETSPIATVQKLDDSDPASVGFALPGSEVKIAEDGEILIRGPLVMMGYWHNDEATRAAIDEDGWFHSGDIGEFRNDRLYITGRAKEIIVMSNGEKVPPGDVEQSIMMDTNFEQVMVVGEGRSRLGLLAVSKLDNDQELVDRANVRLADFPGWISIHHIKRINEPWSIENGFMTPTLKLKRSKIEQHWAKDIEAMYQGPDLCRD